MSTRKVKLIVLSDFVRHFDLQLIRDMEIIDAHLMILVQ